MLRLNCRLGFAMYLQHIEYSDGLLLVLFFPGYPVASFVCVLKHAGGILDVGCCDARFPVLDLKPQLLDQCHYFVICQFHASWICNA